MDLTERINNSIAKLIVNNQNEHLKISTILLQKNADPNLKSEYGSTPLMSAVEKQNLEMVKVLLQKNKT